MAGRIRIVVGEGRTAQRGLLRFVLEGEGFDVVGEAKGSADLSGVIEEHRPDVVVLDDGIGVMAVSMVREVAPDTKVVLVWPSAVVPIGGDARVEPAKILKDLGPAVEHVAAATVGLTETFQRPEWIDRVRKDPATLREKLGSNKESTTRPSVTRLQGRSRRLHPTGRRSKATPQQGRDEEAIAPVVVLPPGDGGRNVEPILDIGGTAGTGQVEEPVEERSEWNRRLGTLALSGAAAVSALVLALALGGGRIPASLIRGGGTLPPGAAGFVRPGTIADGPFGSPSLGGTGYPPIPVAEEPAAPDEGGVGGVLGGIGGAVGGGLGGDLAAPNTPGGSDGPVTGPAPGDGGTNPDGGNGGGGNGGGGGGGGNGGGGGGDGGGGGGKSKGGKGGGGGWKADGGMPGKSAEHNPHGGPPSKMGQTPAHGQGLAAAVAHAKPKHSHKH